MKSADSPRAFLLRHDSTGARFVSALPKRCHYHKRPRSQYEPMCPPIDCRDSEACGTPPQMASDRTSIACLRVVIDDHSRLPGRFVGRVATSATADTITVRYRIA